MSVATFFRRLFNPSIVIHRKRAVMIDVETLSLKSNAAIYMIGAVKFNLGERANESIMETVRVWENAEGSGPGSSIVGTHDFFYALINPSQYMPTEDLEAAHNGFDVSKETMTWTMEKNKALYDLALRHGTDLERALISLNNWLVEVNPQITCSNSPTFDHQIIDNAFTQVSDEKPHKSLYFRNQFDVRTIGHLRDAINMRRYPQLPEDLKLHHPIHDCINQIESIAGFGDAVERGYL